MAARKLDSPQLRSMRWKLSMLDAQIAELRRQREGVRMEMTDEKARLVSESAKAHNGFVMNVVARWDQDMSAPEIAEALNRSTEDVERALAEARRTSGVAVRRGRQVKERRRVRDAHSGSRAAH